MTQYSTVARFEEDIALGIEESWSVVLDFDSPQGAMCDACDARARFLSPDAPWDRFIPGYEFDLYEGSKASAHITVL